MQGLLISSYCILSFNRSISIEKRPQCTRNERGGVPLLKIPPLTLWIGACMFQCTGERVFHLKCYQTPKKAWEFPKKLTQLTINPKEGILFLRMGIPIFFTAKVLATPKEGTGIPKTSIYFCETLKKALDFQVWEFPFFSTKI